MSSRSWHAIAVSFKILTHLLQMVHEVHCLTRRLGSKSFRLFGLGSGVFCIFRNCHNLTGDGLDERENILERFSLAGLHPQQGITVAKRPKGN